MECLLDIRALPDKVKSGPGKSGFIFSKSGLSGLFQSSPTGYVLDEIGGKVGKNSQLIQSAAIQSVLVMGLH